MGARRLRNNAQQSPKRLVAWPVLAAALLLMASDVAAAPLDEKRAEARRVAARLETLAERASLLAEDYNEARLRLDRAQAALVRARLQERESGARVAEVRQHLQRQAVVAYVGGGGVVQAAGLIEGDGRDLVVRRQYLSVTAKATRLAVDRWRAVQEDARVERSRLERAQAGALDATRQVEVRRRQAESAVREQEATLARVQGELAQLVREEEARRAEAARRRAQAELAARQARARAAARTPGRVSLVEPGGPAPPVSSGAASAVAEARRQLGKPYQWGAAGPGSFDCSGLTLWAWRAGGASLPHSSRAQFSATTRVGLSQIQPGDLLFYGTPIHHVGIYAGGGQMIEASQSGTPVRYSTIYRRDLVGIGRVR